MRSERAAPPLAASDLPSQPDQTVGDEAPHEEQVPLEAAGQPAAQPHGFRKALARQRPAAELGAALGEGGIGVEDLQAAGDHARQQDDVQPVADPQKKRLLEADGSFHSGH